MTALKVPINICSQLIAIPSRMTEVISITQGSYDEYGHQVVFGVHDQVD